MSSDRTADNRESEESVDPKLKRRWTIEVCKTCGRLAQWPFCEHRRMVDDGVWWTETVTVQKVGRRA